MKLLLTIAVVAIIFPYNILGGPIPINNDHHTHKTGVEKGDTEPNNHTPHNHTEETKSEVKLVHDTSHQINGDTASNNSHHIPDNHTEKTEPGVNHVDNSTGQLIPGHDTPNQNNKDKAISRRGANTRKVKAIKASEAIKKKKNLRRRRGSGESGGKANGNTDGDDGGNTNGSADESISSPVVIHDLASEAPRLKLPIPCLIKEADPHVPPSTKLSKNIENIINGENVFEEREYDEKAEAVGVINQDKKNARRKGGGKSGGKTNGNTDGDDSGKTKGTTGSNGSGTSGGGIKPGTNPGGIGSGSNGSSGSGKPITYQDKGISTDGDLKGTSAIPPGVTLRPGAYRDPRVYRGSIYPYTQQHIWYIGGGTTYCCIDADDPNPPSSSSATVPSSSATAPSATAPSSSTTAPSTTAPSSSATAPSSSATANDDNSDNNDDNLPPLPPQCRACNFDKTGKPKTSNATRTIRGRHQRLSDYYIGPAARYMGPAARYMVPAAVGFGSLAMQAAPRLLPGS